MKVNVEIICPCCRKIQSIPVDFEDFTKWYQEGVPAQEAFPYLDANGKEAFISGICPDCWEKMFAEDPEEDY